MRGMPDLYPEVEPDAQGMLEITGGDLIYWEVRGNPRGKRPVPALLLPFDVADAGTGSLARIRNGELARALAPDLSQDVQTTPALLGNHHSRIIQFA
jgi:hypothetical protein